MPLRSPTTMISGCLFAWAAILLFSSCLVDIAIAEEPATEQIEQWIEELDDDRYIVREAAQQQLTTASKVALDEVAATAADSNASLESIVRSLQILTDWSVSKDASLRIDALECLAALKNRPLEAAQANEVLADVREQAAIEAIELLGGICEPAYNNLGNARIIQAQGNLRVGGNARVIMQNVRQGPLRVKITADWKGTDEDLKIITKIPRTHAVSLHSAPVGDAALEHFADIPNLKYVQIYGRNISADAIAALEKQLPSVTIDKRSAAHLGIEGRANQRGGIKVGGAYVNGVLEGSAAATAGLRQGDVITELNNEHVEDFKMLTDLIKAHEPGDSVELSVRRGTDTITVPVTFDRWGDTNPTNKQKALRRLQLPEPR